MNICLNVVCLSFKSSGRYVSTSQCDSQTAATSRQAEVESPSLRLVLEQAGQGTKVRTSELEDSPPPRVRFQSADTSGQLSARSSKQSQEGNRFLRKKAAGPAGGANAAPAAGVRSRSRSRAGNPLVSSGVNLESDEEDMRKLLGDSLDSSECSSSGAGRPSSTKRPDKVGKLVFVLNLKFDLFQLKPCGMILT